MTPADQNIRLYFTIPPSTKFSWEQEVTQLMVRSLIVVARRGIEGRFQYKRHPFYTLKFENQRGDTLVMLNVAPWPPPKGQRESRLPPGPESSVTVGTGDWERDVMTVGNDQQSLEQNAGLCSRMGPPSTKRKRQAPSGKNEHLRVVPDRIDYHHPMTLNQVERIQSKIKETLDKPWEELWYKLNGQELFHSKVKGAGDGDETMLISLVLGNSDKKYIPSKLLQEMLVAAYRGVEREKSYIPPFFGHRYYSLKVTSGEGRTRARLEISPWKPEVQITRNRGGEAELKKTLPNNPVKQSADDSNERGPPVQITKGSEQAKLKEILQNVYPVKQSADEPNENGPPVRIAKSPGKADLLKYFEAIEKGELQDVPS
ncbi:MAG: hypothetical protein M1837_000076 [Sclerophora amabilis]|nr:MAG: hypothetical protein M1837_000076 [Sclerophora amabilis]